MAIPAILKGDTSANIVLAIATGYDYTGCTLAVTFNGVTKEFTDLVAGGTKSLAYAADETAGMPLGTAHATMTLTNSAGKVRTMPWVKIRVTDIPGEIYDRTIDVDPSQLDVTDATASDSLGTVKSKLNAVLAFLRGGAACLLACVGLAAFGDIGPTTELNDVPGDTTISNLVVASGVSTGGGGGGGGITANDATNAAAAVVVRDVPSWARQETNNYCTKPYADDTFVAHDADWRISSSLIFSGECAFEGAVEYVNNAPMFDVGFNVDGHTVNKLSYDARLVMDNDEQKIFAYTSDLAGFVTEQSLTNTALRVANRTWDAGYEILWEKMANKGGFYEVCVTNVNLTAGGEQ